MRRSALLANLAGAFCALTATALPADAQLAEQPPLVAGVSPDTGNARRVPEVPIALESAFAASQLRYDRVLGARMEARYAIKELFRERGIHYPAAEIFLRVFKRERQIEVWVRPVAVDTFALLKSYDICAIAGELGPKRRQGDQQVPEGFYTIDQFNPVSEYHLSLHVDYPNRSDAQLGDSSGLGGDIYIHGGCNSIGCIAVTDAGIKEIYWLAVEARGSGQQRIPVHIFPARLTPEEMPRLQKAFARKPAVLAFWRQLQPGFAFFEREHRLPHMEVVAGGGYRVAGVERYEPRTADSTRPQGPVPLGTPLGMPVSVPEAGQATLPPTTPAATEHTPPPDAGKAAAKKPVPLGRPVGGGG